MTPDQYQVIGQKVSYRLALQPGNDVVLKYVRPVVKRKDTQLLSCALGLGFCPHGLTVNGFVTEGSIHTR